jgi:CspA family cold shock protein
VQGVVRFYDPQTGEGVIISDTADRTEYSVAADALEGSIFVTLRQGQRVNFELNGRGRATSVRFGSEPDMGLPTAQV